MEAVSATNASAPSSAIALTEAPSRAALRRARRVCIKAGTSVVANEDGRPSLTRLGAIVEQIAELHHHTGVQVILVSSGAVGMGKRLLRKQTKMSMSWKDTLMLTSSNGLGSNDDDDDNVDNLNHNQRNQSFVNVLDAQKRPHTLAEKKKYYDSACAAAGQFEMMNLYNALFSQVDVAASQLLVTQADFQDPHRLHNLQYAVNRLLNLGIVPIINENDAVSANLGYTADHVFSDNDSLAALCARSFGAEVLLLLTDVKGVYDRPPSDPSAELLSLYRSDGDMTVTIGEKSAQGRGGMQSKIDAAMSAVKVGSACVACVIAAGHDLTSIRLILSPKAAHHVTSSYNRGGLLAPPPVTGTLFCTPGSNLEAQAILDCAVSSSSTVETSNGSSDEAKKKAVLARTQARLLQVSSHNTRVAILNSMAAALIDRKDEILAANAKDIHRAASDGVSLVLRNRLELNESKLLTLASGLRKIALLPDPLGAVKSQREIARHLILDQITVPIGVLMIIFESRPDSMPQIVALALASGNGLLLKGGKEAAHSNQVLHQVLGDAIESGSQGSIRRDIIGLITSRSQVVDLLALDNDVDLIIPRGSNALVSYIKAHTRIPVLGHADGVCHVYVDASANAEAAGKIAVDAKTDSPSACNAMETLLLHQATIDNGVAAHTLMKLRAAGVKCLGGPFAMKLGLCDTAAAVLKYEYGDMTCLVEVVPNVDAAIAWIHQYGSGHTECIVCDEEATNSENNNGDDVGNVFLRHVDAACVFRNASTRFADGFRFGLGAEVGISTGRIHARGPVGVESLLTTQWQLRSLSGVHCVSEFSGESPTKSYTHKDLI